MVKISVITAVYNARDTIGEAIKSVLNQTYDNFELIIIDGASSDGTEEIIENYRDNLSVYVSEPDEGIYDALNKGINHASGEVIGFLHADDVFANNNVLSIVAKNFSNSEVDAVYGDLVYTSKKNPVNVLRFWKSGIYKREMLKFGWMPPHPTFYCRRSIYIEMGMFDLSFEIAADYDCMLRFLNSRKFSCAYIPEVLVNMSMGGKSNGSVAGIIRKSIEDYRVIKKNKVGGLLVLILKNVRKVLQFVKLGLPQNHYRESK